MCFQIDQCQRLWVVDTGKLGLADSPQVCPPKILVFDLNTNLLLHRYEIPKKQYFEFTLYVNPVRNEETTRLIKKFSLCQSIIDFQILDVRDPAPGNCAHTKAYIADVAGFSMLVYDSVTDSSWRVQNSTYD